MIRIPPAFEDSLSLFSSHIEPITSYAVLSVAALVAEMVELAFNSGDPGLIPGLGRSAGEGNGSPLQDSCLETRMDRGAWWAAVHGVPKSWTRLSG